MLKPLKASPEYMRRLKKIHHADSISTGSACGEGENDEGDEKMKIKKMKMTKVMKMMTKKKMENMKEEI